MAQRPIKDTENLTIGEILRYSLEERQSSRFNVGGIDKFGNPFGISKVTIDGVDFTDYKAFSFVWEDSYVKEPERSGSGTIENLNSYAWFLTPHLKIDFSALSIDSYRKLIDMKHSKREFVVTCYDPSYNRMTTNKMYFPPKEMPKLLTIARALNGEQWVELLGVQDYTVEMIGTNASIDKISVLYYDDTGAIIHSQEVDRGTETIIDFTFTPSKGKFDGTWISENGTPYKNGSYFFVQVGDDTSSVKFTPNIIDENEYTLSFNYGNGNALITQKSGNLVSIPIRNGETLSTAIQKANIKLSDGSTFTFPANGTGAKSVVYDGKTYEGSSVYSFAGWFWTNVANEQTRVTGSSVYNYELNRTIYQIYEPIKKAVVYNTNTDGAITIETDYVGYGGKVYLPQLARTGFTHNGWYTTPDFKDGTAFSGTMPPYELTLYAKWVKNQ